MGSHALQLWSKGKYGLCLMAGKTVIIHVPGRLRDEACMTNCSTNAQSLYFGSGLFCLSAMSDAIYPWVSCVGYRYMKLTVH